MWRQLFACALHCFCFAAMALAQAQDPPVGRRPSTFDSGELGIGINGVVYSRMALFNVPAVRKELRLTASQVAKIEELDQQTSRVLKKINEEAQGQSRQLGEESSFPIPRDLQMDRYERVKAEEARREAALGRILTRSQRVRLQQVHYQLDGPRAFVLPEVQQRLNLSPEQREVIRAIVAQGRENREASRIVPSGILPGGRPASRADALKAALKAKETKKYQEGLATARKSAVQVRSDTMRSIYKQLGKIQRKNYERMVGEPFDFQQMWPVQKEASNATGKREEKN